MNNNKNTIKSDDKSNADLREMQPKDNADAGVVNGQKIGVHESLHEKGKTPKK